MALAGRAKTMALAGRAKLLNSSPVRSPVKW
jgi:hypothetical protein